jgi:hypothetical protein
MSKNSLQPKTRTSSSSILRFSRIVCSTTIESTDGFLGLVCIARGPRAHSRFYDCGRRASSCLCFSASSPCYSRCSRRPSARHVGQPMEPKLVGQPHALRGAEEARRAQELETAMVGGPCWTLAHFFFFPFCLSPFAALCVGIWGNSARRTRRQQWPVSIGRVRGGRWLLM